MIWVKPGGTVTLRASSFKRFDNANRYPDFEGVAQVQNLQQPQEVTPASVLEQAWREA